MAYVNAQDWLSFVPPGGWEAATLQMEAVLYPENPLERQLLREPEFLRGLFWGFPRYGHPEGEVYKHIIEVLHNVERMPVGAFQRSQLRLIAMVHDTFKYLEDKSVPRDWTKHHGPLARRFLEKFSSDPAVLDIIELHDEAYYAWRLEYLLHKPELGQQRLEQLLERIETHLQLYYLFFKCDTQTGDKTLAPLKWFEQTIEGIQLVYL